jgi:hypothetical protein
MGCHKSFRDRGGLDKIKILWDFHQQTFMGEKIISLSTPSGNAHYALPHLPTTNERTYGFNNARKL